MNVKNAEKPQKKLYAHHILPKQMGGNDTLNNLFLACKKCHLILDKKSIFNGRLANGLIISKVKTDMPELIGDKDKYQKSMERFLKKR
jgi:hypothetical protein